MKIKEMDVDLATNYDQIVSDPGFFDKYEGKKRELQVLMGKWEEIQIEIESISDQ